MPVTTTTDAPRAWSPDATSVAPVDLIPSALILGTSTIANDSLLGDAQSVRVAWADDAEAVITDEGAELDDTEMGLSECVITTKKITWYDEFSTEQYGQPNAQKLIAASAARSLTRKADAVYLNNTGTLQGLLNVAGITDGGLISGNLDGLLDLQAELQSHDAIPSAVIVSPSAWRDLRVMKTATGHNSSLLGFGTSDTPASLLDVPVIINNRMPAGTGLVLDRLSVVSAVGSVMIAVSEDAAFKEDAVAVRATWRLGQNVVHPERIGVFYTDSGDLS